MPLSRAEIQRRYREKKKESGNYMKNERKRKRKAYIPTALLDDAAAKKRRTETLTRVKRHYEKKRIQQQKGLDAESVQTRQSDNMNILKIKLDFMKKGSKAERSELKQMKNTKDIQNLKRENIKLMKEKRRLQKQLQRSKKKREASGANENNIMCSGKQLYLTNVDNSSEGTSRITPERSSNNDRNVQEQSSNTHNKASTSLNMMQTGTTIDKTKHSQTRDELTPRLKANKILRDSGLSPRKHKNIKRRLLEFHVLEEEVKKSKSLRRCGLNTARKYKCLRSFGKKFGMSRNWLGRKKKCESFSKRKLIRNKVEQFMEREDNCVTMPGKRDEKGKQQKRILTDYLHNLHAKFRLENPGTKISRAAFSKMRPKHVLLVNFCNRNTCLCSCHQNIALKLKAIQDIAGTKNPDEFIAKNTDGEIDEKFKQVDRASVTYTEWRRLEENGKLRWKQYKQWY